MNPIAITGVHGDSKLSLGMVQIPVTIGHTCILISAHVVDESPCDVLLGNDTLD